MDKDARNRVGFFSHQRSGCMWYRIRHPMDALSRSGIGTVELPINEDIDQSVIDSLMSVQLYGSYPFSMEPVLAYFREQGIKIVYDMDDALELIEPSNPNYHMVMAQAGSCRLMLDMADEVTVSTPEMARYARERTKAKVTVIPNCYDASEWQHDRPEHEGIRIGFAGSSSHVPDLIDIIPAIKSIQDKHDASFYIMGFGQSDYESWVRQYRYIAQPEATLELRKLDEALKTIRFEWVPFVDFSLYPKVLTGLSLDIGICPIKDTPFNRHRSACKAMEYTLSGALALSSDSVPYREDNNSMIVGDGDWEFALDSLLQEGIEALKANKVLYWKDKWTRENRDIDSDAMRGLLRSVYVL